MANIRSLAATLAQNADIMVRELEKAGCSNYSLNDPEAPMNLPLLGAKGSAAKAEVISAAEKTLRLTYGPLSYLYRYADIVWTVAPYPRQLANLLSKKAYEIGTIRALIKLDIPSMIPLRESVSYSELASKTNVAETLLKRLIRFAITCGFLAEDDNHGVVHNAMSSVLIRDSQSAEGVAWCFEVGFRSSTKIYEALQLDSGDQDIQKTPLSVEYQNGDNYPSLWEVHAAHPNLDKAFHSLMASECSSSLYSVQHIINAFDWTQIKSMVDVGGGVGHVAEAIANRFPHMQCMVQDTKEAVNLGHPTAKVSFMAHDFFQPQPLQSDLYLYRFIIHDWSDVDAERILTASLPGLRDGARLAIMDTVAPELGTEPLFIEKSIRAMDIMVHGLLSGKERTLGEVRDLVSKVDPKLQFEHCIRPHGSLMSFMTWVYRDPLA